MTSAMKKWLHERGLTAITVMRTAGIWDTHYFYRMLNGKKKVTQELHDTLCRVYGMTEKEYKEAIP